MILRSLARLALLAVFFIGGCYFARTHVTRDVDALVRTAHRVVR
jgi:HAMP domain-containing protein